MNPDQLMNLYVMLIVSGVLLICIEIFIPGGVVGLLGAMALVGAIFVGFQVFEPPGGLISASGILLVCTIALILWIKYFPLTGLGRKLILSADGKLFKTTGDEFAALAGKSGRAVTQLRPSGFALIDGRKYDVVAEGQWIEEGETIRVLRVSGQFIRVVAAQPKKSD